MVLERLLGIHLVCGMAQKCGVRVLWWSTHVLCCLPPNIWVFQEKEGFRCKKPVSNVCKSILIIGHAKFQAEEFMLVNTHSQQEVCPVWVLCQWQWSARLGCFEERQWYSARPLPNSHSSQGVASNSTKAKEQCNQDTAAPWACGS